MKDSGHIQQGINTFMEHGMIVNVIIITGFLLKDYTLNPFHIFITPAFWLVIYILLVKFPVKSIFRENSLSFTIAAVFYFTTVFIMGNTIRYNLAALPAYVTGVMYLYNKKLFLRDRWKSIAILTLMLFGLQFFIRGHFTNTFNDKALLIISLWLPYPAFYYLYRKMGLSLREILYIIFLVNGLVFISPKVGMSLSTLVNLSYILIVNLLVILFGIKMSGKKSNLPTISFPLFVLLLYALISPVYIKNEVGYFRGKNRFRNIINTCVEAHNIQFDAVSGRAADNIMLFRKVAVIGVLGPDYEVGSFHRDKGYIHDTSCLTKKRILVFGFPFKKRVSLKEDAYFDEFLHALPLNPSHVKQLGTCNFIYDLDTTNSSARVYTNLYLIEFQ